MLLQSEKRNAVGHLWTDPWKATSTDAGPISSGIWNDQIFAETFQALASHEENKSAATKNCPQRSANKGLRGKKYGLSPVPNFLVLGRSTKIADELQSSLRISKRRSRSASGLGGLPTWGWVVKFDEGE